MRSEPSAKSRKLGLTLVMAALAFAGLMVAVVRAFTESSEAIELRSDPIEVAELAEAAAQQRVDSPPPAVVDSHQHRDAEAHEATLTTGSLAGRVVDSRQRPVDEAFVRPVELPAERELPAVKTDAKGKFSLPALPPGKYRLRVFSGRHQLLELDGYAVEAGGELEGLVLVVDEGESITGQVETSSGEAVAGARVGSSDRSTGVAVSDDSGQFRLSGLAPGETNLFATAAGYAPARVRGVNSGSTGVRLLLNPEAKLVGKLADLGEGESRLVSVCSHDPHFDKQLCVARQLVSSGRPTFEFKGLAAGQFEIVITKAETEVQRVSVALVAGSVTDAGTVALSR